MHPPQIVGKKYYESSNDKKKVHGPARNGEHDAVNDLRSSSERSLWNDARSPRQLFLISFLILFLEMSSIRWLNASVTVLAYFNNLILVSCFFGLGVGCLLANRRFRLIEVAAPCILLLVAAVVFLQQFSVDMAYDFDILFAVMDGEPGDRFVVPVPVAAILGFFVNVVLFVLLGQELGRQLAAVDNPLRAYAYDIGGSLVGTLAFGALALLWTPPHVWYGIGLAILLVFLQQQRAKMITSLVIGLAAIALMIGTYQGAEWSPYYKVETKEILTDKGTSLGHNIIVDNRRIQDALDLGPGLIDTPLGPWIDYYMIPYHFIRPEKVLILGAGAGNEAYMALLAGGREIHAVEIDPLISSYGRFLHPKRPYSALAVRPIVDDARAYITKTDEQYDLILISALDSHKQIAGMSNLRLESFFYTVESLARMSELLEPDGVFCLNFISDRAWVGNRIYWSLTEAFGREPRTYRSRAFPYNSVALMYGPDEAFDRELLPQAAPLEPVDNYTDHKAVSLATDNWPYLYLKARGIPGVYLFVLAVLLVGSTAIVIVVEPQLRRPSLHYFFLGAGFMLLETRSVTQMALLFGSTWNVNTVVFAAILATILIANFAVIRGRAPSRKTNYIFLLAVLVAGYFFPFHVLLELSMVPRLAAACVVVGLPIIWASFIFSISFKGETNVTRAFGSNLLGVVFGGSLEYLNLLIGLDSLYLVAVALYAVSWVLLPRR